MNFGGPKPDAMMPTDPNSVPPRPSAAPPPCPRCELVKSQCTKTIINYQKSHRKKIDALRTELKSSRQQVESLQRQLRGYRVAGRVVPAVAAVAAAGWLLLRLLRKPSGSSEGASPPQQQQEAVPAPQADEAAAL
ncbi:hypothetical protein PLESTB_001329200 [Pleodorina starrii]|uniref:Uncharacterized protein n=1 Tax=Pleodorina starrii TaxID=330485 RepID=A0A9W6BU15_9CHLO|nr:hypothetical protein PLESTM_001625200 [Pleodorina starrii]GLC58194.1 hypothetical protein PLESTB_001329200 [Pleodorina starrii]GLC75538.1 hypothetical protein PLESTF_001654600 [Pleodorina starrii]